MDKYSLSLRDGSGINRQVIEAVGGEAVTVGHDVAGHFTCLVKADGASVTYVLKDAVDSLDEDGLEIASGSIADGGYIHAPEWDGIRFLFEFTASADCTITIVSH